MQLLLFTPPKDISLADITMIRSRSYSELSSLINGWHSLFDNCPAGMRVGFIFLVSSCPIAAAMWGRPVARHENQVETLELTRLAHSPAVPRNFGTWALGRMRKWIRVQMPEINRLISYHDTEAHHGTIYKADNWRPVYTEQTKSATWLNRSGRTSVGVETKTKWEREP